MVSFLLPCRRVPYAHFIPVFLRCKGHGIEVVVRSGNNGDTLRRLVATLAQHLCVLSFYEPRLPKRGYALAFSLVPLLVERLQPGIYPRNGCKARWLGLT
ncbi:hypothetical protein DQ04_06651030 [Trypanosoma grayi]|uniref:hypothetical protein n=1 Tax=Trypanosoma grayi TaxID=71804 RepID=UPI0004F4B4FA|nr:hypothetical protein DQ04_06651030 [Trypanosoma grayi]KEG08682.1 hypothetical protein DQ04_06651030 [Trypanosoma grayi]